MHSNSTFVCLLLAALVAGAQGGCPFASGTEKVNFTGDWLIDFSESQVVNHPPNKIFHMCQDAKTSHIYFSITLANDTLPTGEEEESETAHKEPWFVGFGFGNWSAVRMGIGGLLFFTSEAQYETPYVVLMDRMTHEWEYEDANYTAKATQLNTIYRGPKHCAIPYRHNEIIQKNRKIAIKRNRNIRLKRKKAEKDAKAAAEEEGKTLSKEDLKAISDAVVIEESNEDLKLLDTDSVVGQSWTGDSQNARVMTNETGCFWFHGSLGDEEIVDIYGDLYDGKLLYNGLAFYSAWTDYSSPEDSPGRHGRQFYLQYSENEIMDSYGYRGYAIRGGTEFELKRDDTARNCPLFSAETQTSEGCDASSDSQHCEL